jgi:hypothetical protein
MIYFTDTSYSRVCREICPCLRNIALPRHFIVHGFVSLNNVITRQLQVELRTDVSFRTLIHPC